MNVTTVTCLLPSKKEEPSQPKPAMDMSATIPVFMMLPFTVGLGAVMAHVIVRIGNNLVESLITKRSVEEMKLNGHSGDQVHRSDA